MPRCRSYYVFGKISVSCLITGLLVGVTGCGSVQPASSLANSSPQSYSGSWAKQLIFASESTAAGIRATGKIERLILVQATQDDDTLATSEQVCDVNAVGSKNSSVKFPEALKRAFPTTTIDYQMTSKGEEQELTSAPIVEVLGSKLSDPETDSLPTKGDDPKAFDQDKDGQPGVTIEVSARALLVSISGRIYLTQRTKMQQTGRFESSDRVEGQVKWTIEQKIFGSDSAVLGAVTPSITPLLEQSTFRMQKLPDGTNCAELLANRNQYFEPLTP